MTRVLGFDVGQTGSRAALFDGPERVATSVQMGCRTIVDSDGLSCLSRIVAGVAADLGLASERVDVASIGLTGIAQCWSQAPGIADAIRDALAVDRVIVTSDMVSWHAGALHHRPGVVVAAGTGAVAMAVGPTGESAHCDGWGYLLGDDGGGQWIGRAGLVSALRSYDGRAGSTLLQRLAERRYGGLEDLPAVIHGAENPAGAMAAFAEDVAQAAREGDADAQRIWSRAGHELAATATAAARRVFQRGETVLVSYAGSLFQAEELLMEPFRRELARLVPLARLTEPAGDALDGARHLAMSEIHSPYERLLLRVTSSGRRAKENDEAVFPTAG
ncbi:MAG TPA: BadF/BadG/BcrA/BcrD ATPase family protein [Egibacteraceae bacterium]|nr:BadF/BadG/BcrA/BcrD ATPase family protein [Egibacteraceae bacterium]